jgi:hypothetical protein
MAARAWPTSRRDLEAARRFLRTHARGLVAIAADRDVDGLSAAVLLHRTLLRLGGRAAIVPARRGEHVHAEPMRARLRALGPASLAVVDMGSGAGEILSGIPTLVIDHHQPAGLPAGAVVVSAFGHPPVASTSLLAYHVVRALVDVDDLAWLALLGVVADLGAGASLDGVGEWLERYGRHATTEAVALLRARGAGGGRRAAAAVRRRRGARAHPEIQLARTRRPRHHLDRGGSPAARGLPRQITTLEVRVTLQEEAVMQVAARKSEGELTRRIESQTARIPSGTYLTLAIASMVGSLVLMLMGARNVANFVGQWAPTILIMGLYNKLVKLEGHE